MGQQKQPAFNKFIIFIHLDTYCALLLLVLLLPLVP